MGQCWVRYQGLVLVLGVGFRYQWLGLVFRVLYLGLGLGQWGKEKKDILVVIFFRVRFRVRFGFRVRGLWGQGLGVRVQGLEFRVRFSVGGGQGLGQDYVKKEKRYFGSDFYLGQRVRWLEVQGQVQGLGFRVYGLEFRVRVRGQG